MRILAKRRLMKRKTRLLLEITWDDELDDHPMTWNFPSMMARDPFTARGEVLRVVSFEDVDDERIIDP